MKTTQHITKCLISSILLIMCSMSFLDVHYACAQPSSPYSIKIPTKFGKVKERYRGDNNKVVIHIQDAHTSYEAQENIANIIQHLVGEDVVDVVAVEGAEGKIDLEPFRLFPVDDIRWQVAANMTAYGDLTGAELAGIGMKDDVELFGVEDMGIYYRNLDKFRTVMNKREDILIEIEKIEEILNNLKAPLYSMNLRTFDEITTKYYAEEINFIEFTKAVIEYARTADVDLYDHVNIALFMESLLAAADNSEDDKAAIEKERTALIYDLLKVATDQKLLTLLHKLEENGHELSQEKQLLLDSFLVKQLRGYACDEHKYKHFIKNAMFAEKFGRVDKGALLDEVEVLAYTISQRLAKTDTTAEEHVNLVHNLRLMKHLIELKVVPAQVEAYRENAAAYSSVRYMNFLREQTKLHGIFYHPSARIALLDEVIDVAAQFYRFAEARSRILVKNTMSKMKNDDQSVIALVAGGYHTDDMVEAFKKKGYSYLVVSPRIDNMDLTVPYMERMMNVKSAAQLRFESAFNTIVAELTLQKDGNEPLIFDFVQKVLSISILAGDESYELPLSDHLDLGRSLDVAADRWKKNESQLGTMDSAEVITTEEGDIYVIPDTGEKARTSRVLVPVMIFKKDALTSTEAAPGILTPMEYSKVVALQDRGNIKTMALPDAITQAFSRLNLIISGAELTSEAIYLDYWKAIIDAFVRGQILERDLDQVLEPNAKVLLDFSEKYFNENKPTKTILFTPEIVREIGRTYQLSAYADESMNDLQRGAAVIKQMIEHQGAYALDDQVSALLKSYYGPDITIDARIEFIGKKGELSDMQVVLQGTEVIYTNLDEQTETSTGRPGKETLARTLAEVLGERAGRPDITIFMHRNETELAYDNAVIFDATMLTNLADQNVNLYDIGLAPKDVPNIFVRLFQDGKDIVDKIAAKLAAAQKKVLSSRSSDTSA